MPNSDCRALGVGGLARAAHAAVRSTACRTMPGPAGSGGHTSSTIWMSAPIAACAATAASGVKRCIDPSYVDLKVTPSSSTTGDSENTWKPPESVSM